MQDDLRQKASDGEREIATIGRNEVADAVYRVNKSLSRSDARRLVDQLLEVIIDGLKQDGTISLYGFGVFNLVKKAQRVGRNPKTGEQHMICKRCFQATFLICCGAA